MKHLTQKQKENLIAKHKSGTSVSEICRKNNISRTTFYNWLKLYEKKEVTDSFRLSLKLKKTEQIIEVLKLVNCTPDSPLQEKLYELEKLQGKYSVYVLCEALNVSRGTYYNHILRNKKGDTVFAKRNIELTKLVIDVFNESNQVYGGKKIVAVLKFRGIPISEKTVLKIMKENHLSSIRTNSKKINKMLAPKKDKLNYNFTTSAPNQVWVSDTSYIPFKNKHHYLCVILDLYSRKVISHKFSEKHTTNLISATFAKAYTSRDKPKNLTFHSDQGVQYTANSFQYKLKSLGVTQSFSPKGKPTRNSVAEAFFSNIKQEHIHRYEFASLPKLKASIDKYILNYNSERPHKAINYKTPDQQECSFSSVQS